MKILSGYFYIFVLLVTFFLLAGHLAHWAVPVEQRQITRIIIFLTVYANWSFVSIYLYRKQAYFASVPDWYEGFVIVAMFYLVAFISPEEAARERVFDSIAAQKDSVEGPAKGGARAFYITQRISLFVFQIHPSRIITLIATEVLNAAICPLSKILRNGMLVIEVIQSFSTTLAVTVVIRFEAGHNSRMQGYQPRLKLWTFKTVLFLEFIQSVVFSALGRAEAYRPTQYVSYYDLSVGLNEFPYQLRVLLVCFDAFMYIKAFEFGSYRKKLNEAHYAGVSPLSAFLDIVNPIDILRGTHTTSMGFKTSQHVGINGGNQMVTTSGTPHHTVGGEEIIEHKLGSD